VWISAALSFGAASVLMVGKQSFESFHYELFKVSWIVVSAGDPARITKPAWSFALLVEDVPIVIFFGG
jgi:hypothetical protein